MRIEKVTAHAFGPLKGAALELAPGLTVIAGGNESAKSSWHAAINSALCGRRRGRGASTKEERRYAELHRPWDGGDWRVSAVVVLDDGRRVELSHDLDGKVDCRAIDLGLARDVSAEIMFEGSPDGSRFLGLDRRSFASTASVNQAQLLNVLDAAEGLQEHLQRAAATAGADATAAAALERLEQFQREHVGLDRANSSRPLRAAITRLQRAEAGLQSARDRHAEYLRLVEEADNLRDCAAEAASEHQAASQRTESLRRLRDAAREAAHAQAKADQLREIAIQERQTVANLEARYFRAHAIHERFAGGPPAGVENDARLSRQVATALGVWNSAPETPHLQPPTAQELQSQLDQLPQPPDGDTTVDPTMRRLVNSWQQATALHETHLQQSRPSEPAHADPALDAALAAGPVVLRELAASLDALDDNPDTADNGSHRTQLEHELAEARAERQAAEQRVLDAESGAHTAQSESETAASVVATPRARRRSTPSGRGPVAVAAVGLVGAGVLTALGHPWPGLVFLIVLLAAAAALRGRPRRTPNLTPVPEADHASDDANPSGQAATDEVAAAQSAYRQAELRTAELEGRQAAALAAERRREHAKDDVHVRCTARQLPIDSQALRKLAVLAETLIAQRTETARWTLEAEQLREALARAERNLRSALWDHGMEQAHNADADVAWMLDQYEVQCEKRAQQAREAAKRSLLLQALTERTKLEASSLRAIELRAQAVAGIREAARSAGVPDAEANRLDPEELGDLLTRWQREAQDRLIVAQQDLKDWAELTTVLGDFTLDSLAAELDRCRANLEVVEERVAKACDAATDAARRLEETVSSTGLRLDVQDEQLMQKIMVETETAQGVAERRAGSISAEAEKAEGALAERAKSLPSVPEAEEEAAAAQRELCRVKELAQTLDVTVRHLVAAQERAHRDIAPVLAGTLREWLPRVTAGRYIDAMVNPSTLSVQVCGRSGRWRDADCLSVGTAEQIYLLLRVALAQHLAPSESCPLLLDDVTVQADEDRTRQVLELLLALSESRQIVLFAQEPGVWTWASEHLLGSDRHSLHRLPDLPCD